MPFDLTVPVGGLAVLSVWGRLFEQETRTEFAYLNTSPGILSLATEIVPAFEDQHLAAICNLITSDWNVYNIRGDAYEDVGGVMQALGFRDHASTASGTVAPPTCPPQCAGVLRRRVGTIGRANRGRIFYPGVPYNSQTGGKMTNAYYANMMVQCAFLANPLKGGDGVTELCKPMLLSRAANGAIDGWQFVQYWDANPVVRSQRRREFGVGM